MTMESSIEVESQNFALLTLKERCHFLKQQLKAVDEENIKLKVQIASNSISTDSSVLSYNSLISELEILKKQKEQLSNQIHILATENNNMWSRLSRLTVVNRNLTRRYTKIADTLEKYGINSSVSEPETGNTVVTDHKDYRKNLEQMSLQLINDIKLEKSELEKQYAQMVDLHKNEAAVIGPELAFASLEDDEDTVMAGVRKHAQKLHNLKQILQQQQSLLYAALEDLKKVKSKEKNDVRSSEVILMDAATEPLFEETVRAVAITPTVEILSKQDGQQTTDKEQICPMCGAHIPGTAQEFCDHVSDHFDEENEDPIDSYVHVP